VFFRWHSPLLRHWGKQKRVCPGHEAETLPNFGTGFSNRATAPSAANEHVFGSILGPSFETLKALISGLSEFVPKLTHCETVLLASWVVLGLADGIAFQKDVPLARQITVTYSIGDIVFWVYVFLLARIVYYPRRITRDLIT
jgi:hypothetical protein